MCNSLHVINCLNFLSNNIRFPVNINFFKATIETLEKRVKYVQS